MNEYDYKTTNLIADYFDEYNIPYRVCKKDDIEEIVTGFSVDSGPSLLMHYVNSDDDNDLTVLLKLINGAPLSKRVQLLEACNNLNKKRYHVCFFLNDNNDVMISYDFLQSMTDDCIGEASLEILRITKAVLDDNYSDLMKAIYLPDSEVNVKLDEAFMKLLSGFSLQGGKINDNNDHSDKDEGIE